MRLCKYLLFSSTFLLSTGLVAQCAKPDAMPKWNGVIGQFSCPDFGDMRAPGSGVMVQPRGDKSFCRSVRDNLVTACPSTAEGKSCRNRAQSISKECFKGSKNDAQTTSSTNSAAKTDVSVCMKTFDQQQQACQSRRMPTSSSMPDTCLKDALTARDACMANSR